jgi:hypothetical protein
MLRPHKRYTVSLAVAPSKLSRNHKVKLGNRQHESWWQFNRFSKSQSSSTG